MKYDEKKKERVRKYGEVFTPDFIVNQMCDDLEKENPDCFLPNTTFLEPTCGDGAFVVEVLRRKFERCRGKADYQRALRSVYGMEIQEDNVQKTIARVTELCRTYFAPTMDDLDAIKDHYIMCDSLKIMRMMNDPQLKG